MGERRTEGLRAIESELLSEIERGRDAEVVEWVVLCLLKQAIMVKTIFFFFSSLDSCMSAGPNYVSQAGTIHQTKTQTLTSTGLFKRMKTDLLRKDGLVNLAVTGTADWDG